MACIGDNDVLGGYRILQHFIHHPLFYHIEVKMASGSNKENSTDTAEFVTGWHVAQRIHFVANQQEVDGLPAKILLYLFQFFRRHFFYVKEIKDNIGLSHFL